MDTSGTSQRNGRNLRNFSRKRQKEEIKDKNTPPTMVPGNVRSLRGRQIPILPMDKRGKRKKKISKTIIKEAQPSARALSNPRTDPNQVNPKGQENLTPIESNQAQNQSPPPSPTPPNPTQAATSQAQTPPQQTNRIKLDDLYIDPKQISSYSTDLKRYLREKETLSRHKRIIRKFKRRKTIVNGPYTQIQSDTM